MKDLPRPPINPAVSTIISEMVVLAKDFFTRQERQGCISKAELYHDPIAKRFKDLIKFFANERFPEDKRFNGIDRVFEYNVIVEKTRITIRIAAFIDPKNLKKTECSETTIDIKNPTHISELYNIFENIEKAKHFLEAGFNG